MKRKLKLVDYYSELFRDLINSRVWQKNGELSPGFLLKLNNESDWSFICVAMDIVDDATAAIQNYENSL